MNTIMVYENKLEYNMCYDNIKSIKIFAFGRKYNTIRVFGKNINILPYGVYTRIKIQTFDPITKIYKSFICNNVLIERK